MFRCNNPEMLGDGSLQVRLPTNEITVHIRDDIPGWSRKDLTTDILESWALWTAAIAVKVSLWVPDSGTTPTQIVTAFNFGDGIGGIQADQELPYGPANNLRMRIDIATAKRNRGERIGILTHENGHCLGALHSSPTDGVSDLMDPVLSNIWTPQAGDVAAMLRMGYGKANAPKPAPDKGRFIELFETDEAGQKWTCKGYFTKVP